MGARRDDGRQKDAGTVPEDMGKSATLEKECLQRGSTKADSRVEDVGDTVDVRTPNNPDTESKRLCSDFDSSISRVEWLHAFLVGMY
jgi:hypothetical protein